MEPTLPVFLYRLERHRLSEAITQQLPAVAQQLGQEDADAAFTFTRQELEVMIEGLHLRARFLLREKTNTKHQGTKQRIQDQYDDGEKLRAKLREILREFWRQMVSRADCSNP
jgi:hypothetical protein